MRWQWLVVLVIVSFASSESSADEVQTLGDYYGDMSVTTDSDGEVTPGRFGDYSDWVKKYHIGAHHPYHATKVGEHKVRHHKASSTAPAHVAKPAAAKATKKVAAKVEKSSRSTEDVAVEKPAEQKVSEEKESQHTKGAAKQDAAVVPDPADALEAELAKLEHSSADDDVQTSVSDAAPAKAATDSESTKATDSATAAAADDASHKKETKAAPAKSADNLRESKDGSQHISLDSLESTLKQLESKPVTVLLQTEREGYGANGANDNLAAVPDAVPNSDSFASDATSDTMGAVYTMRQDQMKLSNFPTQHVPLKASAVASAVHKSSSALLLGEATAAPEPVHKVETRAPAAKHKKLVGHKQEMKKTTLHKLDKKLVSSQAKIDAGLDALDAKKAKIAAMIDAETRKDLVTKARADFNDAKHDSRSFETQLDDLEQTAELDEQQMSSSTSLRGGLVSLIEEQESSTAKNSASADASIKAPDMLAMLAAKFKHKEESRRKDAMSDAKVDEDKAAQKEAAMAKKFQSQFMLAEDKHAKKLENKHAPKNIEEALAKQTVKLQPGEKAVGKGSVGHEDAKAEAEAVMAKKMTQQFVSYQKTLDTKSKKTAKKATKESLTALFGLNKAKAQKSEQQDLGEQAETGMSAGDESAMKWAAAALHKSEGVADKAEHKNDEDSTKESKETLAEMFGLQHQNDVKKTRSQLISESRKKLLGDGDKQALEMQTAMTQRSMQLQQQNQANADAEVGGSDSKGDLASLFKGSKQQAKVAADSNTRFAENQEATQQLQQQQEVLLASQNREAQAHNSKDPALTHTSVASLFKGQTQQASKSAHKNVPQDVKDAMKMQQQFTQNTQTHDHKDSDKAMTESNVKALFGESNDPKEQTADLSNSVGEEAKQQQLQMLKQTNSRSEGNVGEALGNLDGTDKHSAIEHLFQGTQHKQQGEFAYKSKGEQKKLQHEFASAANHQITLLKSMQTAQVNSRAQESLQESQSNHGTKWDELAYQNKLRGLFGAKLIKKPKQQQLRHKHAVSQFQDEINAATSFANAKPKHKSKSARAKQTAPYQESAIKNEDSLVQMDVGERRDAIEDLFRGKHSHQKQQKSHKNNRQEVTESKPHKKSPQALNKQFDSLLQEETNQFQQLMKSKKQQMGVLASKGQQLAGEEFLHLMKEKFDELKTNVATYTSEKKQPADPIASGDSLVQVQEASNTNDGAGNNLKERIHSLAPDTRKRVLKDVAETVLDDPSSTTLHSSMLNRLTKLFHESD